MRKLLLFLSLAGALTLNSQTTLFQDNFEASTNSNWTLNNGIGDNQWVMNNIFAGDGFGGLIIVPTPNQPAAFTGGINSKYLHIHNQPICGVLACNANFDTGSTSDQTATINSSISTVGMNNINVNFWYLCGGDPNITYGFVEYSTDGSTWTQIGADLSGVSIWTQLNLTDIALANQPTLKFRFHWINGASGLDPAFSVDELEITGVDNNQAVIATNSPSILSACFGTDINFTIPFSAMGNYGLGNVFTAELSNASGSFGAPIIIGTLNSSSNGNQTINATIPSGTAVGSGYRIRVTSSSPAAIGTDNGLDFVIHPLPFIVVTADPANGTINVGQTINLSASGASEYLWSPAAIFNSTVGASVVASPTVSSIVAVLGTDQYGCSSSTVFNITVNTVSGIIEEKNTMNLFIFPNPAAEFFEILRSSTDPIERLTIRDTKGKKVRSYDKPKPEMFFVDGLSSGEYFVSIKIGVTTNVLKLIIP
jgi:hypothetical protein